MHLRARLALIALLLMLVPTITLSIISIDSRIATMIDDMSHSSDFMIAQIFEEVRLALSQSNGDVTTALRGSQPVRKLLDSTVAFGPAVVAASIVANDDTVIVAANGEGEGKPALRRFGIMCVDEDAPSHASARRGQANLRVRVRPVHRHGDSIHGAVLRRGEDRGENGAFGVVPLGLSHRPVGVAPFDVRELARVERRPGEEHVARQRGIAAASCNQSRREADQRSVCGAPVDRARRVVLGVGVVVAALAEAELRAHAEHRRPTRREQKRE